MFAIPRGLDSSLTRGVIPRRLMRAEGREEPVKTSDFSKASSYEGGSGSEEEDPTLGAVDPAAATTGVHEPLTEGCEEGQAKEDPSIRRLLGSGWHPPVAATPRFEESPDGAGVEWTRPTHSSSVANHPYKIWRPPYFHCLNWTSP